MHFCQIAVHDFLLICHLTLLGQANLSGAFCDPKYWSSLLHHFWTSTIELKEVFVGCGLLYRNKNFSLSPTKEAAAAKAAV